VLNHVSKERKNIAEHNIIAEYRFITEHFNIVTENAESDDRCSAMELANLYSLFAMVIGRSSLDTSALSNRVGNHFFQSVASYLCDSYPGGADFKEYVSCSDTDYF